MRFEGLHIGMKVCWRIPTITVIKFAQLSGSTRDLIKIR